MHITTSGIRWIAVTAALAAAGMVLSGCGSSKTENYPAPSYDVSGYCYNAEDSRLVIANANLTVEPASEESLSKLSEDSDILLNAEAAEMLNEMTAAAAAQDVTLTPCRGYDTENSGKTDCAEHETGLAVDFESQGSFEKSEAYAWLNAYAADYGFILRYPADKAKKTGVKQCSCHWRYVGVENARAIVQSGLSLEAFAAVNTVG